MCNSRFNDEKPNAGHQEMKVKVNAFLSTLTTNIILQLNSDSLAVPGSQMVGKEKKNACGK